MAKTHTLIFVCQKAEMEYNTLYHWTLYSCCKKKKKDLSYFKHGRNVCYKKVKN